MTMNPSATHAYADLGDAWLRYQTARIQQTHIQFGRHFRLDLDALVRQRATATRAARVIAVLTARAPLSTEHMRRALIEAMAHCARVDASTRAPTREAVPA